MNRKELKIRWARSYIEPSLFYLPVKGGRLVNVTVKPLTHIKDRYFSLSKYSLSQMQYYIPMYNEPDVTGNIPRYSGDNIHGNYKGCKYRIYKKTETDGVIEYVCVTKDGVTDRNETSPLLENEQTLTLPKGEYYYKEYVSAPGDILHFKCEKFVIDNDTNDFTLEIDHKPRLIRVYPQYIKGKECFTVADAGKGMMANGTAFGNALREEEFYRSDSITENPYYKIFPKVKKIEYMDKDFSDHINYVDVKNTAGSITVGINEYEEIWGSYYAGLWYQEYYEKYTVTPSELKINSNIYFDDVLIHTGYEMVYTPFANSLPYYENDAEYGVLYSNEEYGKGGARYKSGFVCYPGFALSFGGNTKGWAIVDNKTINMEREYDFTLKPIDIQEEKYFEDSLYTLTAELAEHTGNVKTIYENGQIDISESTVKEKTAYSYACPEDTAGMPMWLCKALTAEDPEISDGYTPPAAGAGMPLRYSITLYEKEVVTNNGENDVVYKTISKGYSEDEPLLPYDSPNVRKANEARYGSGYFYGELEMLLQEGYTRACNVAVVFERQSRRGYKQWYGTSEMFESNDNYSKED